MEKRCGLCKVTKPSTQFYPRKWGIGKVGLNSRCIVCARKLALEWAKKNKERHIAHTKQWRALNKEKHATSVAKWASSNKHIRNEGFASRRAAKKNATPAWANKFFMEEAYDLAQRRSKLKTGGHAKWHVDHIVPLQSPIVCGLHVEHNLRVIPATENLRKHNKIWPDMP